MNTSHLIALSSILIVIISGVIKVMSKQSKDSTEIDNIKKDIKRIDTNFKEHELLNERFFDKYERNTNDKFNEVFRKIDELNKNINDFIITLIKNHQDK